MAANLAKERRAECEREAWKLRQRGWTEERIAAELGIDQSTVSRMLARVETRLAKSFEAQAARIKARQTAQLEHLYSEALEEWERSKLPAEADKTVTKTLRQKEGNTFDEEHQEPAESEFLEETITHDVKGQTGNPALLAQARGALSDIRDIWGLNAPKQTDVTTGGLPFKVYVGFDPTDDGVNPPDEEPDAGDSDRS